MLVSDIRINENRNSYLFILWEMKIWIWKHKLFKSKDYRSVLTKTSLLKNHFSNYFLTTKLVLLLQKLWPWWKKLFQDFNSGPFINALKRCVGCNRQSFASWGLQSMMCGRKARDALLRALLVSASSVMDKSDLPHAKAGSHHGSIQHLCKNMFKKGW